jgi:arsenite-transporting ATPase
MGPKIHFFIGKGGVGKSTTSVLSALHLAHSGHDTLLVSMDPAHNQRDILELSFSEKPKTVARNFAVKEVDIDYWMSTYLKDTESEIKKVYSYHSAFNIQNYFNVLKYSPGLEEYALLLAYKDILRTEGARSRIIIDMPPTALTMRFFSLPSITLIWLDELLKLRCHILDKKEIVSKIKFGKKEIEQDKVKTRLEALIDEHLRLRKNFTADRTRINVVINNDPLSVAEAERIHEKLADLEIQIAQIVLNKARCSDPIDDISTKFGGFPIVQFPRSSRALYGKEALMTYILENRIQQR